MHYSSCEDPKIIFNKYIGEYVSTPCRHCDACMNIRSMEMTSRLQNEMYLNKYSLFITLTYSNEYVPYIQLDSYDSDNIYFNSFNHSESSIGIERYRNGRDMLPYILSHDCLPIVCRRHIDLFMKRLRRSINYNLFQNGKEITENEKLRYYIVSEYGPKTLRPHYHGILFINDPKVFKFVVSNLAQCWQYGYVSSSVCNVHRAKYVTKYVSSRANMPHVYDEPMFRCFRSYSRCPAIGFGRVVSPPLFKDVTKADLFRIVYEDGVYVERPNWRCYEDRYFPKCRQFSQITHNERVALYGLAFRKIYDDEQGRLVYYHPKRFRLFPLGRDGQPNADWNAYRISNRVLKLCEYYNCTLDEYVTRIEKYYEVKSMEALKSFYQFQVDESKGNNYSPNHLIGIYGTYLNYLNELISKRDYCRISSNELNSISNVLRSFGFNNEFIKGLYDIYTLSDTIKQVLVVADISKRGEYSSYLTQSHDVMVKGVRSKYVYDIQSDDGSFGYQPYVSNLI